MAELMRIRPTRSRANRAADVCASRGPPMKASSRRITRIERGAAVSRATRTSCAGETLPNVSTNSELPIWSRSPCCNARSSAGSPLTKVGLPRSKSRTTTCCPFHARTQCCGEIVASASAMQLSRSEPMLVSGRSSENAPPLSGPLTATKLGDIAPIYTTPSDEEGYTEL